MKKEANRAGVFLAVFCVLVVLSAAAAIVTAIAAANNGAAQKQSIREVIIDPGHGGVDGGAVGVGGVVEKGINLSIALKLKTFFAQAGFKVIMTRQDDRSIHDSDADTVKEQKTSDLHNRFAIIQKHPGAIFISIHQNKFDQSQYFGTQTFYSPNNPNSKLLASLIQHDVQQILQPENDREIKQAQKNLYLLYYAKSPAVMVECGFLSNPSDAAKLQEEQYQNKMAFTIFYGALHYYSELENQTLKTS